jgi:hypothetical protein
VSIDVPYLVTNKRLPELFGKMQSAAVPNRFSFEFLKKLGFGSSNDRAFPSLLKKLGFVDPSGAPTDRYRAYRNPKEARSVMAQAVRELYAELFAVDENVYRQSREHVRGVISRVTGMEEKYVNLAAATFTSLCNLSDFAAVLGPASESNPPVAVVGTSPISPKGDAMAVERKKPVSLEFRHCIEIHLPATTNLSVYNAIFRSLRDQLGE